MFSRSYTFNKKAESDCDDSEENLDETRIASNFPENKSESGDESDDSEENLGEPRIASNFPESKSESDD